MIETYVAWSVGHAVLTLRGDLDEPAGPVVAEAITRICRQQPLKLFVDLTDIARFADIALGRLATVVARLRQGGCPLVFINPTSALREQMHVHGLEGLLQQDSA